MLMRNQMMALENGEPQESQLIVQENTLPVIGLDLLLEPTDKHTLKAKRGNKSKTLWGLDCSPWFASGDTFFRLDLLDVRLPTSAVMAGPAGELLEGDGFGEAIFQDGLGGGAGADFGEPVDFGDMDMVDAPAEICVPQIEYAKAPGYVDVKKVKEIMNASITEILSEPRRKSIVDAKDGAKPTEVPFNDLFGMVRDGLPVEEKGGLTVAIAFICALHLCNDHNIELVRPEGEDAVMGDFNLVAP